MSEKVSIGKIGLLIVPLSNVTLPPGEYSIGIKTNSPNAFHTASNVKSYRGYDNGEELPTTALNLNYPYSDMYGIFPSFSLLSYGSSIIDLNNRIGKIEKFGMNKREMIESLKCLGDNLNDIELKVLSLLRKVKIVGYRGELKLTVVVSNGSVTTLRLINSEDNLYLNLDKVQNNGNGCYYNRIIQHHQGSIITVEIEIDTNGIADFNYSYDSVLAPNLVFVETQLDDEHKKGDVLIPTLCENGIIGLQPIGKRKRLLGNTMYMKFQITEAVTLGSVLLYVENLPTNDINWVQVAIYPKDNGLCTAKMITTSNKIEVTSIGYIRLPLEHKVLQPGLYSIGIKTNCLDSFSTAQGVQSYRGYDSGNSMPTTAMNLKYPYSDGYGIFPSFSLVAFNEVVGIKYPANWGVKYEPEYSFIGQNDEKTLNCYIRGEDDASGGKIRKFYISNDGGLTKSQMHENNLDWEAYKQWGEPHTCVVTYGSNDSTIYYNTQKGYVIKCHIVGGIATLTDITPSEKSESASSYTVASYAPLVLWKGYLWWGEYQDPKTPRIHKMNISTEQWSISVEKPTNGVNGARHCHFLYKSPVDPNVLWAVWGDASNGAGQGINRLYAESITSAFDNWEQWTIGLDDAIGTTLPYPTAIIETYEDGIIGAGDQPPTHLLKCRTRGGVTGKYLIQPLNFKMETAPSTETCHWIAMDEEKTIYYMTVESNPYMSVYASPYPYTQSFRISKYWQQALAGAIGYSKGYIQTRNYRFPKLSFINAIDARNVSKVPYVAKATSENIVDRFNKLIDNLVGANILQSSAERGNDINTQFFVNPNDQFENWG